MGYLKIKSKYLISHMFLQSGAILCESIVRMDEHADDEMHVTDDEGEYLEIVDTVGNAVSR